jgi:hypothetical protein
MPILKLALFPANECGWMELQPAAAQLLLVE